MKILLLSAYDAASHQRWRNELEQHLPDHQWTQLSLPPRYFNWRIRGNSLSWAFSQRQLLAQDYDVLLVTSMVDLSALRGFIPSLARIPTLMYFHENQFAYPAGSHQVASVEPQMISLYAALCADTLVFNSEFNRTTFLRGVEDLLRRLPDKVPEGLVQILRGSSQVLPVPLSESHFTSSVKNAQTLQIVWNHRWEYDKGPERLLAMLKIFFAMRKTQKVSCHFILHVVGQQFRQEPAAFAEIRRLLEEHQALGQWGYLEDKDVYRQLLSASHIVISTALHDFQGLAVLEAVASACVPLVPARQAYPEFVPADYCYPDDLDNPGREAEMMAQGLLALVNKFDAGCFPSAPPIEQLSWSQLAEKYEQLLRSLVSNKK